MAYTPTEWTNSIYDADGEILRKGTPLMAENMNKIETALTDLSELPATIATQENTLTDHESRITANSVSVGTIQAEKGHPGGYATLDTNGIVPVSQLPSNLKEIRIAANLAERDTFEKFEGLRVLVTDASADPTVDSGWAEYVWDGSEFIKVAEAESLDVVLSWGNVTGKPTTFTPTKHTHTENEVINSLGYKPISETNPLFIGNVGIGTTNPVKPLTVKTHPSYAGAISIGLDPNQSVAPVLFFDNYNGSATYKMLSDNSGTFKFLSPNDSTIFSADNEGITYPRVVVEGKGSIYAPSLTLDITVGDETGLYVPKLNNMGFITDRTERMRVDEVGNIGVGTQAPTEKLDVDGMVNAKGYKVNGKLQNMGITEEEKVVWNNAVTKVAEHTTILDELATHTHSYASLTGKPTLPTQTSQLTNDSGYVTSNASKITVSATAPENPQPNDLWIVV